MTIGKLYEICAETEKYLRKNGVGFVEVWTYQDGLPVIDIRIESGDWKHEHLRTKMLMQQIGAVHVGSKVLDDDDGSDTYTAVHRFIVNENIFEEVANENQ